MREHLNLSGTWRFQPDPFCEGEGGGYAGESFDVSRWREASVPSVFDACGLGLAGYEGTGWFRRTFFVPRVWAGQRVVLRFEGVNYHAAVWINGRRAGRNEDGFLCFDLPVHTWLRFGEENTVAVRVDNERRKGEVPGLERGWRPYGGILREVFLLVGDPLRIERFSIQAAPAGTGGILNLVATLANDRPARAMAELSVEICDAQSVVEASFCADAVSLDAGAAQDVHLSGVTPGVQAWSPGAPHLYTARLRLRAGDEVTDQEEVRFGFRTIAAQKGKLLLNGQPVFLTGFNRHEDSPRTGPCPDYDLVRQDLLAMKESGANFVRLCHYPHHPAELDLCDEIGLLVMEEIPLWWWNGLEEGAAESAQKLDAARRQLERMIRRDARHPCTIFWSVSNETREDRPEVADGNATLVRLARELDPTRLAMHVSCVWRNHPHFEEDDVLGVNGYPSWGIRPLDPSCDFAKVEVFWPENLEKLHQLYPGKPILVTEFGHPSLEGVFGSGLGEDVQARAIEVQFAAITAPYVCGATIWCYADHPWPEADWIKFLTTSPFGVVTRERRKLAAFHTVRRIFQERQGLYSGSASVKEKSR